MAYYCCNKKPKQPASRLHAKLHGYLKLDAAGKLDANPQQCCCCLTRIKNGLTCHLALATCHLSRLQMTGTTFKAMDSYNKLPA